MSKSGKEKYKPITYENSRAVGNIGEAVAIAEFSKMGIPVYIPFGQNTPVDMIIYINGMYLKVQVKTTETVKNHRHMEFSISRTNGFTNSSIPYKRDEVDLFFLYCVELDWKGLIFYDECPTHSLNIRLDNLRNNQFKNIKRAYMYDFYYRIATLKGLHPAVCFDN